jgi:hypothetical protein
MSIPIAASLTKSTISLPKIDSSTISHPTDSERRTWTSWSPHPRSSHTPCTRIREPDLGRSCSRRRRTAARRPLHSVVQAHPSIPDTRSSVFCSYSSHWNGCIGGMGTTRRGGYRIAVLAFGTQIRQEDHTIPSSVELTRAALVVVGDQISTPLIKGGKVKEIVRPTQLSVVRALPHQPKLRTFFVL